MCQVYQQYIINISLVYHENINIRNITSSTQYTKIYVETKMGENHGMFSYIYQEYIHRKQQIPNSIAPTGRRHQPKGSYNSLNFLAPTRRRLQPPDFQDPT
jgi:hypothetical protein